ncbi:MAG: glycolate oxidase subunit GlcE, partial [Pikeienuella sp.]
PFHGQTGAVWRVSVKPTDGPKLVEALRSGGDVDALYDWGGGLVWLQLPDEADAGASAIRAETKRLGGHATLIRASEATRAAVSVFEPEAAPVAALATRLRRQFDPSGILNPGLMG